MMAQVNLPQSSRKINPPKLSGGKPALLNSSRAGVSSVATQPNPTVSSDQTPKMKKWFCMVCNRSMSRQSRRSHEKGKGHLAKIAASKRVASQQAVPAQTTGGVQSPPDPSKIPTVIVIAPRSQVPGAKPGGWTCSLCSMNMHETSQYAHERGKKHQGKLRNRDRRKQKKPQSPTTTNRSVPASQGSRPPRAGIGYHSAPISGSLAEDSILQELLALEPDSQYDSWFEDDDEGDEPSDSSSSGGEDNGSDSDGNDNGGRLHPNGQRHIQIRHVPEVYNHDFTIPWQAFSEAGIRHPSWDTLVTPEVVEEVIEKWELRLLVRDIDTQWGMIPGGGAYKESNHYYGPDAYDYY